MLIQRMIRAARLNVDLYEEVETDVSATVQALQVVIIVAICTGLGAALSLRDGSLVGVLIGGLLSAILGWLAWSYITYFIGTRVFAGRATYGELLRTIGFANSPGVFMLLRFIPVLGGLITLVVAIWLLLAGVIAVRQALDVDTGKAAVTVIIGWLAYVVLNIIFGLLFGASLG